MKKWRTSRPLRQRCVHLGPIGSYAVQCAQKINYVGHARAHHFTRRAVPPLVTGFSCLELGGVRSGEFVATFSTLFRGTFEAVYLAVFLVVGGVAGLSGVGA